MFGPLEIPQESLLLQRFAGNEPILEVKKWTLPKIGKLQNMEIFIISTTSYRRFAREIPNELNESDVFGENNLRQTGDHISQSL